MDYTPHVVAFLDILGFSEICMKSDTSKEHRESLKVIFDLCQTISSRFEHLKGKKEIKSMIVSDSIVLTLALEGSKPTLQELANFFLACGQFQYYLGKSGFWLRGGISIGSLNVNFDQKQVVGPALIRAVNLEKKVARYPRIVVDPLVMAEHGIANASDFRDEINALYSTDGQRSLFEWRGFMDDWGESNIPKDVPLFIDFMRSVVGEDGNVGEVAESVAKGLRGAMEHYEKYRWLGDYILAGHRQRYIGISPFNDRLKVLLG
ncbi:hypothetical protein [Bdellovibrio sp.]|uniref:hypothetical protein n=1 Tax=Bdellovibrio sp. TaxID=28201 RepID=UPI0039E60D7A